MTSKRNTPNTIIYDTLMGGGKTTYNIQEQLKSTQPTIPTIIVAPSLNEVGRYSKALPHFKAVETGGDGNTKTSQCLEYIENDVSMIITHALLDSLASNAQAIKSLSSKSYRLILDEVPNSVNAVRIPYKDLGLLTENGYVTIVKRNGLSFVKWINDGSDSILTSYKTKLSSGNVAISDQNFVSIYPKRFLQAFTCTWIFTYMFEASYHRCLLNLYGIKYEMRSIVKSNGADNYVSVPYQEINGSRYKNLVTILDHPKLNERWEKHELSLTHLRNAKKPKLHTLQKDLTNLFKNIYKGMGNGFMWTIYEDQHTGRKKEKIRSAVELAVFSTTGRIPKDASDYQIKIMTTHVPVNAKGTNDYSDRYALAYMVNRFCNPTIVRFFKASGVTVNQDDYCLSELLQWIWRSRIRKSEAIYIYLPASRMRKFLSDWLGKPDGMTAANDNSSLDEIYSQQAGLTNVRKVA